MVELTPDSAAFAQNLQQRRQIGTFIKLADLAVVEICCQVGLDFGIVDLQHSQLSEGDALRLVHHAWAIDFPAVVRIPVPDSALCNRLLEAGACGIQLADVRSVAEIEAVIAATRYPPAGRRSVSLSHPLAGFGSTPLKKAVSVAPPLVIGQFETADTVDSIPDIMASGLDVAFLGITDLTVDFEFDTQRVDARINEVKESAAAAEVALGVFASTPDQISEGATYVAVSSDVSILTRSFDQTIKAVR